jgi:putative membrane protein
MMFDLQNAIRDLNKKVKKQKLHNIKLGIGTDQLNGFTLKQGVGPTGLKTAVFETNGQKTAYVIFDANNMAAGLREKIISAVKKTGVNECEVMTTDSHCVNNVRGVENPLGEIVDQKFLVAKAVETTKQALADLTPVEVGVKKILVDDIDVLGPHKTAELVATTNSMIAIMKIAAPIIFIVGTTLSLLGVLLVPW